MSSFPSIFALCNFNRLWLLTTHKEEIICTAKCEASNYLE